MSHRLHCRTGVAANSRLRGTRRPLLSRRCRSRNNVASVTAPFTVSVSAPSSVGPLPAPEIVMLAARSFLTTIFADARLDNVRPPLYRARHGQGIQSILARRATPANRSAWIFEAMSPMIVGLFWPVTTSVPILGATDRSNTDSLGREMAIGAPMVNRRAVADGLSVDPRRLLDVGRRPVVMSAPFEIFGDRKVARYPSGPLKMMPSPLRLALRAEMLLRPLPSMPPSSTIPPSRRSWPWSLK